jgi:predicted PhzF superfamily epimerase YddE/YHI9
MLSERKGFRLVHNIIKKLLEERDNAVAELEKMKRANTGKKALVIDIPSDDELEECRVKKSRKAMVEDVSDTKQSKVQLAKKEKLTLGGDTA